MRQHGTGPTITVLIVDDEVSIRRGLRMRLALESDLEIVGEAQDGLEAIKLAKELQPDVIVLDVEMPHLDGIAAMGTLRLIAPRAAIVVLSIYGDEATRERARQMGARAFIDKQGDVGELSAAIRAAAAPGGT